MAEIKIEKFKNYLGGFWIHIEVSKEITTEINLFRGINELNIREILKSKEITSNPESKEGLELFQSENIKY